MPIVSKSLLPNTASGAEPRTALQLRSLFRSLLKRRPQLEPGSGKSTAALLTVVAISALILGEKKRRASREPRTCNCAVMEHPLFTWIAENAWIFSSAWLVSVVVPPPKMNSYGSALRSLAVGSTAISWFCVAGMALFTDRVYAHLPWFCEAERPRKSFVHYFSEWIRCNVPVEAFNSLALGFHVAALNRKQFQLAYLERKVHPLHLLVKFAVMRLGVDIGFWLGHRILHMPQFYWIHRRHHEHFRPSVSTSFHFSPLDLWIEGVFPFIPGLIALDLLKMPMVRFEENLITAYIIFHEVGSHCGKALPTVTYFPPLAPLYQLLFGDVDAENVKHHDVHHARLNCNYSIVIWPDIVMGTRMRDHKDQITDKSK